jgi:tetratricopeptide (TPR) repeat protein
MIIKLLTLIFLLPLALYAQHDNGDSLIKVLPTLTGKTRIDCLNELGEYYLWAKIDSADFYTQKALTESSALNYQKGIDVATFNIGSVKMNSNQNVEAEEILRQTLLKFNNTDEYHAGWNMIYLSVVLMNQCKYDEGINLLESSIPIMKRVDYAGGDAVGKALTFLGLAYGAKGDYEKGLDKAEQSYQERQKTGNIMGMAYSLRNLANLYNQVGDYTTALGHYQMALQLFRTRFEPAELYGEMAQFFIINNQLDSGRLYAEKSVKLSATVPTGKIAMAEIALKEQRYDTAIATFKAAFTSSKNSNNVQQMIKDMLRLSNAYTEKKDFKNAVLYLTQVYDISKNAGAWPITRDASNALSTVFHQIGKTDSAYKYLSTYTQLKESIFNDQFIGKLFAFKNKVENEQKQAKIELLSKEAIISEQQLKEQSLIKKILIGGIAIMLLLVMVVFRNIMLSKKNVNLETAQLKNNLQAQQMEAESKQLLLLQKTDQLEMKALRVQMNPHFIFNCLSSINRFILINNREEASDYLTKFSRLIRMSLQNSEKPLITLETELDMLKLYLELERLRFKNAFNYSITFINTIESSTIFIPPLLLQPFAENAIWHGLMHKEGVGNLDIALSLDGNILHCEITDNGIGRQQASLLKSKSAEKNKSMGMQITVERLALLNSTTKESSFFAIEDIINEDGDNTGTKVLLKIKYKGLVEAAHSNSLN